jgi:Family of unknown function (DUF6152)
MVLAAMKPKQTILILSVAFGILLVAVPQSFAHHSRTMFDMGQNVTYQGVVKEYRWENPHSHIVITVGLDAKNPSTAGTWDIEASSVNLMVSEGWTRTTYKPGDSITIVAHPMKNGSKGALLFYAIKPDGTRFYRAQHRYPSEEE